MAYPVSRRLTRRSGRYGAREPIRLADGSWTPAWHGGEDFTPLNPGTRLPVYAVGKGTIIIADKTAEPGDHSGLDIGIRLDGDRSIWWYGHLSRIDVNVGQRVTDGQQIGLMGATGRTTGVHLHLERHWPALNVETDPWPYIEHEPDHEGLTSSWQTGNPPAATGDSGTTSTQEDTMYRIKDADGGAVYLVTDRGLTHIKTPAHDKLFDRMTGQTMRPEQTMNALEIANVAGYIAAAGATDRAQMEAAVRGAIAGLDLKVSVDVDSIVDELGERIVNG